MSPRRIRLSKIRKRNRRAKAAIAAKIRSQIPRKIPSEDVSPKPSTSSFARKHLEFQGEAKHAERSSHSSSSSSDLCNLESLWEKSPKKSIDREKLREIDSSNSDENDNNEPHTPNTSISFISDEALESIEKHELLIERNKNVHVNNTITGNRVVEIQYYTEKLLNIQYEHNRICTFGKLCPIEEDRRGTGLVSTMILRCTQCSKEYHVQTENPDRTQSVINTGAVWGTLAVGSTFAHLEEMHSIMDIPAMSRYKFTAIENKLGNLWKDSLWETMKKAGEEEKRIALEKGNVDEDNIPKITVYLDGGWSKRSYGHNYNAASGVGVIIGQETGKVLWVGVRNKYCTVCARAANKKESALDHNCFRNWSGSSSAMEADIIVEGFCRSEEMHGVKYLTFVADGDSSVFVQIKRRVPYGQKVEKIECLNHVVKNYGKALYTIKNDKNISAEGRKLLTTTVIKEFQKSVQQTIYLYALDDIDVLKTELQNTPYHTLDDHQNCKSNCENAGKTLSNKVNEFKKAGTFQFIQGALEMIIKKSKSLVDKETNNRAETYMNILARFNAGKRINFSQKGSFQTRSYLAGLRYNEGVNWHVAPWRRSFGHSPGDHLKKYISNYQKCREQRCTIAPRKRKTTILPAELNTDYGKFAEEAELEGPELQAECDRFLATLQVSEDEIKFISQETVGQFDNPMYRAERQNRLTASNFGAVINRRSSTPCHSLVQKILYPVQVNTPAVIHGKLKENAARIKYQTDFNCEITLAGLYIDKEYCFLAASPDGLLNNTHVIEIKCVFALYDTTDNMELALEKEIKRNKSFYLEKRNNKIQLKRNHHYFYQVQGQMRITGIHKAYFIVFLNNNVELFVEEILYDGELWKNKMEEKLIKFYKDCILVEIILGRIRKNKKCKDPQYVIDAQKK